MKLDNNQGKNVTSDFIGYFQTVEQIIPKENVISAEEISAPENSLYTNDNQDGLGELLTTTTSDELESEKLEKLLKEQEAFLESRVDAVIAEANIKAKAIVEQANDNARFIYEDCKQKAFEEGYSEGIQKAEAESISLKQQYEQLIRENEEALDRQSRELEGRIVDTVCQVLDNITGICVSEYEETIVNIISRVLSKSENSSSYYIRVSAKDYQNVLSRKAELLDCVREDALVDIIQDADMMPNQCLIETDGNVIDAGLDEQLRNLKTNLRLLAGIN